MLSVVVSVLKLCCQHEFNPKDTGQICPLEAFRCKVTDLQLVEGSCSCANKNWICLHRDVPWNHVSREKMEVGWYLRNKLVKESREELSVAQSEENFSNDFHDFMEVKVLTIHAFLNIASRRACLIKFYELTFSECGTCLYVLDYMSAFQGWYQWK